MCWLPWKQTNQIWLIFISIQQNHELPKQVVSFILFFSNDSVFTQNPSEFYFLEGNKADFVLQHWPCNALHIILRTGCSRLNVLGFQSLEIELVSHIKNNQGDHLFIYPLSLSSFIFIFLYFLHREESNHYPSWLNNSPFLSIATPSTLSLVASCCESKEERRDIHTCKPFGLSFFTATRMFSPFPSGGLIQPLYTLPNPPSPILSSLQKSLVALLSSLSPKTRRLWALSSYNSGMLRGEETEPEDLLVCFAALKSSDLLTLLFEVGDETSTEPVVGVDFGCFWPLYFSLKWKKHLILQRGRWASLLKSSWQS